jgi:hypothetical protein
MFRTIGAQPSLWESQLPAVVEAVAVLRNGRRALPKALSGAGAGPGRWSPSPASWRACTSMP